MELTSAAPVLRSAAHSPRDCRSSTGDCVRGHSRTLAQVKALSREKNEQHHDEGDRGETANNGHHLARRGRGHRVAVVHPFVLVRRWQDHSPALWPWL